MAWDKNLIAEGVLAPDLNDEIRANWAALEAMLNAWMRFETGGTQTGQPRQGSARVYFQDAVPTARLDGEYFDSADLGCIWVDSNATIDNQVNQLTAADGAGTEIWTPISTEIIAVLLASARTFAEAITFDKAAILSKAPTLTEGIVANNSYLQARNVADSGNVDLIKADGSNVPTVPDDTANATSGAPTAAASLANKKYVDDNIGSANYTPTSYANEESVTLPNGLIMKFGTATTFGAQTPKTITFGTVFPTACKTVALTGGDDDPSVDDFISAYDLSVSSFKIQSRQAMGTIYWMAIGY